MSIRIGLGYDVHKLQEGVDFWLGGVKIDHNKGALGHSDADVVIHAICDALLGALSLGDIGKHFPDTNPEYKDIDSKKLLLKVVEMIKIKNYRVGNVDVSLALESPKIASYIPQMKEVLSKILEVTPDDVSVKATTSEKLGFVGREEGVEAQAVALLTSE